MSRIDLSAKFPQMKAVKSPPALFRINGCGVGMYGARDHDQETGTYVSTWCLSLLFLPVLCLRAYRVARSPQGWYFIGREPLSGPARGWNVLVLAAVLVAAGGIKYSAYTSTPAYQAKRQMAAAHSMAEHGQLAQAARMYQGLAVAGADQSAEATAAIRDLLDSRCAQAPLAESVGVFTAAAQVARRGHVIPPADVATKGLELVAAKGDAEPKAGVSVLDAIRPIVIDTRPVDARRLALLRKIAANEPGDLEAIIPLASLLDQQGQAAEAKQLLLPVKDKLGDGEGARVLGVILGREGDNEGAYALLWPYVKARLDRLHAAEKASEQTVQSLWDREVHALDQKQGPADFYEKYQGAGPDERHSLVREYVSGRIRNDPQFTSAQEALERETAVVPVALELGIVMLQRAQAQTNPEARKLQLEAAEKTFLAIRGVAGESDEYRVSLGQVYYWLGKQPEGRKLFDELLAAHGRAYKDLLQIASRLRELGAPAEARVLAEEAYTKAAKSEERYEAAQFRSLCSKDNDDQIAWLSKADVNNSAVSASLAKALGDKAMEEGRDADAARQYRAAADAYAAMPRSAFSMNEAALAYYGIFGATGDRQALARCQDFFQQAVDLSPGDPILMENAAVTLLGAAMADVIGSDIDLRTLHESGSLGLLSYLHHDEAGRAAVVKRVKEHPGVARAVSFMEKVTVLSPKSPRGFATLYGIHCFTRNQAALRALEQRIRAAGVDSSDALTAAKEYLSGAKDQQTLVATSAALKRSAERVGPARAKGGPTAAVALDQQAALIMALDALNAAGGSASGGSSGGSSGNADLDQALALAEEAHRLAPSSGTESVLMNILVARAARDLRRSNPAFDAFMKKYERSVGPLYLIAVAASNGPFVKEALAHPDVKRAMAMDREQNARYDDGDSSFDWALFKNADPAAAEAIASHVRGSARRQLDHAVSALLQPYSATEALDTYWLMQILGKPDEGRAALSKVAESGIPVPGAP